MMRSFLIPLFALGCFLLPAPIARAQYVEYKITAPDGAPNDRFGESAAVDGTTAVIGAFRDDDAGTDAGAVYVFDLSNGNWSFTSKLTPGNGIIIPGLHDNGLFGSFVDIRNDVIVVGAVDGRENGIKTGAAYVFEKNDSGVWTQQKRLIAPDGLLNDLYGNSVATNGEYAFVGALDHDHSNLVNAGAVYVYKRTSINGSADASWDLKQKLTPSDAQAGDSFGWSVDVSDNRAIIGARDDDDEAVNAGSAYIYELENDQWIQKTKLYASDAHTEDSFGEVVAINGDQAIVGARDVDTKGEEAGAAYVFERQPDGSWLETGKLLASDGVSLDRFGNSVTIEGDYAAVSTRINNDLSGAVYVFQNLGNSWTEVSKITPANLQAGDLFGQSINISGTFLISGTKGDDDKGVDAGAAHIFDLQGTDRGALIALYNATNGPNWTRKNSWLSNAPIGNWYGVTTNSDGRVTGIDLENNNLSGTLPAAIGEFPFLKTLNLSRNQLSGRIPDETGDLSALETLDLANNGFIAALPAGLASLNSLTSLFLNDNAFTGAIPDVLTQIENLETLYLNNNQFSGAVPQNMTALKSLKVLHLESNLLVDLPDFDGSTNGQSTLDNLVVFDNRFTFEDLEPNREISGFAYSPQAQVGQAETKNIPEKNPLVLQIPVGGSQNIYTWKKNGESLPGSNADTYIIPSAAPADAGVYTLEVTNQLVDNLTISSQPITVNVIPVTDFAANLSGFHVVSPLISAASGSIESTLLGDQLTVSGAFEQLSFPFNGAYLHIGAPGVDTEPFLTLNATINGQNGVISASNNQFELDAAQIVALQNGLFYVSIETQSGSIAARLAPELRGQLYASPNAPPSPATITTPLNGSEINLGEPGAIEVKWSAATDPNGHPVDYLWAFSRSQDIKNNPAEIDGIFRTNGATSFSISHENIDAFLAAQGVAQGASVVIYHLVSSSDGSLYNTGNVASINITRSTQNQSPRVNIPIADFTYVLEDGPANIDLSAVFSDPDADALTFEASSSNNTAAQVNVNQETLVITPTGVGETTVSVTAKDVFDAQVTETFELTINSRPQITNLIADLVLIETDTPFNQQLSTVFDDADPLTYHADSENPLVASAEIMADGVTLSVAPVAPGLTSVTVSATDSQGASASFVFDVTVQSDAIMPPQSVSESINITFGNADQSASYRLVALPGDVNLPLAGAINGTPEQDWIAFRDNGQDVDDRAVYFERYNGSAGFTFKPGTGFWLLSKLKWERTDNRPTVTLAADASYTIALQAGWNIISNPFDIDVPWSAVSQKNEISQQLYRWDNRYIASTIFSSAKSGNAFYFFNSEGLTELKIPYLPATSSNTSTVHPPALEMFAISERDTVSTIRAGRHQAAESGFDKMDQIAPPDVFEDAGLRLIRKDAPPSSRHGLLTEEYLPSDAPGYRYDITLHAPVNKPLILHVAGQQNFEDYQEILLFDKKLAKRYDLRKNSSITFWPNSQTQDFVLLIGEEAYVETEQAGILPVEVVLLPNYPNPFTTRTTIAFAIPEPSTLRIVVYDALGRQVRLIADGVYNAGHHQIDWDGLSDAGTSLSSGLYFYKLQLQETQIVRSMILRR